MLCPKCDKPIDLVKEVQEFEELSEGEAECGFFINLWCEVCKDMVAQLWVEENTEHESVEVPSLREVTGGFDNLIVDFPKSMKRDKDDA